MSVVVGALVLLAALTWPDRQGTVLRALREGLPRGAGAPRAVPAVEVASAMELLALVLQSGAGIVEALETVGRHLDDVLGTHLLTVSAALRWGMSEEEAWGSVPPAWAPVAGALTLAAQAGAPPADLLVRAAADVRHAERHRLEAATARLGVTVVLPLGLAFLPGFILTTVVPVVIALTSDVLGL